MIAMKKTTTRSGPRLPTLYVFDDKINDSDNEDRVKEFKS